MSSMPLILALPEIALEKILSFLTYDEIARNRLVCTKFNQVGDRLLTCGFRQAKKRHKAIKTRMMSILPRGDILMAAVETRLIMLSNTYMEYIENNVCSFIPGKVCTKFDQVGGKLLTRGFLQAEKRHNTIHKRMKSMLPRRESERRSHSLARHCDILSAVETRLSMLTMTYMKYMENNVCCFIPGKVIDEIDRILTLVENVNPPPRTHELLQELRDISSMAMEHFDEVILPRLKQKVAESSTLIPACASTSKAPKLLIVQQVIADEIHKMKKQTKANKQQIASVVDLLKKVGAKFKRQSNILSKKSTIIREQERKLQEQATKLQEQDAAIADLKKHVDEWDQKFSDLTAELIRAREDLISKSVTPAVPTPPFPRPNSPKFLKSNIKPRSALPKFYEIPAVELERKRKASSYSEIPYKMVRSLSSASMSDDICNKINENITSNISKNITDSLSKNDHNAKDGKEKGFISNKGGFGPFLSSSIEMILKAPINSIKSRKRKMSEDIDLK